MKECVNHSRDLHKSSGKSDTQLQNFYKSENCLVEGGPAVRKSITYSG